MGNYFSPGATVEHGTLVEGRANTGNSLAYRKGIYSLEHVGINWSLQNIEGN